MRNLSATGAIHSPIDADRDVSAYLTDFDKLGLPDHSPFEILSKPRAVANTATAPKKRGPKKTVRERTLASLRDPGDKKRSAFMVDIPNRQESDRTSSICGRRII